MWSKLFEICLLDGFEICFVGGKCVSLPFTQVQFVLSVCVEEGINKFLNLPPQCGKRPKRCRNSSGEKVLGCISK